MAKGLPKSYIKKYGITKKAWREYRKSKGGRKTTRKKSTKRKTTRRSYTKKNAVRRIKKLNLPIALIAGTGAGLIDPIKALIDEKDPGKAARIISYHYLGYNVTEGQFDMNGIKKGLLPLIAGALIHKFVGGSPLNVNKSLAGAGVPILRI